MGLHTPLELDDDELLVEELDELLELLLDDELELLDDEPGQLPLPVILIPGVPAFSTN